VTPQAEDGLYTSATLDERSHELILKVINDAGSDRAAEIRMNGARAAGTAKVVTLESDDLNAENSFEQPQRVAPRASTVVGSSTIQVHLAAYSLTVYRIPLQ
jgi:alpha-N-arabinofuranosidase